MHLTKPPITLKMTTPQNTGGGRENPLKAGDKTPQQLAVFLCPSFFGGLNLSSQSKVMNGAVLAVFTTGRACLRHSHPNKPRHHTVRSIGVGNQTLKSRHYLMKIRPFNPDFSHRYVSSFEDSRDLTDSIHLMADRAISVLALLSEQFESKDSYSLNHTTIYLAIHYVEKELQEYLNAFSQTQKNPA